MLPNLRRWVPFVAFAVLWTLPESGLAAAVPFSGTLSLRFGALTPIPIPGSGTALVNGSAGGAHVASLGLASAAFDVTNLVVPLTDPAAAPIRGVIATASNGSAAFAGLSGGMGGGVMPLRGVAKLCLAGECFSPFGGPGSALANLVVPFTQNGTRGVGIGGGGVTVKAAVNITVTGAPWTQGTAAIGAFTAMGFGHGPASASSTTAAGGVVQLVTPIVISTNIGAIALIPAFGVLSMFVPEPGTFLLLGTGAVALALHGRRRLAQSRLRSRSEPTG